MKVYLAGKVSGLPTVEVFIKFAQAEFWLREKGYDIVNPLRLCSAGWTWERCMKVCLTEMMGCDAICLLRDWGESQGARLEFFVASQLGLKMLYFQPKKPHPVQKGQ